jgi:hypothetical protein
MKNVVRGFSSIFISFTLLLATSTFAQSTAPPAEDLTNVFASVDALMVQVKAVCVTEECIALTVSGSKFSADGRVK